jgi:hypothetical protein
MATGADVLTMLLPAGGWIITADDFDSVIWVDDRPRCTKEEFEAGFPAYDAWKAAQEAALAADKVNATAKLEALGLTADDLKALGL